MKPPVLPLVDLELHRARVEQRIRLADDNEEFSLAHIVFDFDSLPTLAPDANAAELAAFVARFFEQVPTEDFPIDQSLAEEIAI